MSFDANKFLEINPPAEVATIIKQAMTADPDPVPAETLCTFAQFHTFATGNHAAAEALYKAALHILGQCGERAKKLTVNVRKDYSNLLREMGRDDDALAMWPDEETGPLN